MTGPLEVEPEVLEELQRRGVSSVYHFTPARNLPHILRDERLRSVDDLDEDVRAFYANTDPNRFDGHTDKISCSLEFPNAWYLRRTVGKDKAINYPDWVILELEPEVAAIPGALFCYRNAAAANGRLLQPGATALISCYAYSVIGAQDRTYTRGPRHNPAAPTDGQAEVMVPGPIPLSSVRTVIHSSASLAAQEWARLERLGRNPAVVDWASSPKLFDAYAVTSAAQNGSLIEVTPWVFGGTP
ncbi:DarT ssDNA thymidine ADP-ribosyltransferase family protein [Modestobacter roseus]|uniref:DarT ssDNA thymidine ADP-ribosyltransferase family protein n=1 Tax=Modestobacter roseus TaxID=1181884 RepID=UPI0018862E9B